MFSLTRILSLNVRIHTSGVQLKSKKKIIKLKDIGALKFNNLNIQNRRAGGKKTSEQVREATTEPTCDAGNRTQATAICLEASALTTVPSLLPHER